MYITLVYVFKRSDGMATLGRIGGLPMAYETELCIFYCTIMTINSARWNWNKELATYGFLSQIVLRDSANDPTTT